MIERILEATGLDDIGLFIARFIIFSLFFVGIMWIGYRRGWWTGSNDWEEGRGMITRLYQQSENYCRQNNKMLSIFVDALACILLVITIWLLVKRG